MLSIYLAAAATANIDPFVLALASGFGGVLVSVTAGLIGAFIQSRREHKKWLKERRYEAYLTFITGMDALTDLAGHRLKTSKGSVVDAPEGAAAPSFPPHTEERLDAFLLNTSAFYLLGPDSVARALRDFGKVASSDDTAAIGRARHRVFLEMRRALEIKTV